MNYSCHKNTSIEVRWRGNFSEIREQYLGIWRNTNFWNTWLQAKKKQNFASRHHCPSPFQQAHYAQCALHTSRSMAFSSTNFWSHLMLLLLTRKILQKALQIQHTFHLKLRNHSTECIHLVNFPKTVHNMQFIWISVKHDFERLPASEYSWEYLSLVFSISFLDPLLESQPRKCG